MAFPILAAAAVGGAVASYFGQKETNDANRDMQNSANSANAEQAQLNRDWQERMSNTAHQRQVADLKKAGLNPILSANSGASSPSGSTANFQAAKMENSIGAGISSARESMQLSKELESANSQIGLNNASAKTQTTVQQSNIASAKSAEAQAEQTRQNTLKLMRDNKVGEATINKVIESSKLDADSELRRAKIDNKTVEMDTINSKVKGLIDTGSSAKDLVNPLGGIIKGTKNFPNSPKTIDPSKGYEIMKKNGTRIKVPRE